MGGELFIYWRVAPEALADAGLAMQAWQAGLCAAHPGLQTRLYRRTDAAEGQATLMETYAWPGGGIDEALHRAIVEQGAEAAAAWCVGKRHVEVFEALAR